MELIIQTKSNYQRIDIAPGKRRITTFDNGYSLDILATSTVKAELNLATNTLQLTSQTDFNVYQE